MGLCLFFDVMYLICKKHEKNIIGVFAKTLAAFCFITIGYMAYLKNNSSFTFYILIGLILDGIGDLMLGLRNIFAKRVNFAIGGIFFLLGHIMYIRALFLLTNYYAVSCVVAGLIFGVALLFLLDRACHFSKAYILLGVVYLEIISIMASLSIGVCISVQSMKNYEFLVGAILFLSSDILLTMYNFSKKARWLHAVYSIIYFIGQLLISLSLHI